LRWLVDRQSIRTHGARRCRAVSFVASPERCHFDPDVQELIRILRLAIARELQDSTTGRYRDGFDDQQICD
jgi:hypothetical protein